MLFRSKNSWLTGTAAWNWYAITQFILGIKPGYKGLIIDPCIPSNWESYIIKRKFRGSVYEIKVFNKGAMKGVKKLIVNGEVIEGNVIPLQKEGSVNNVEVYMGVDS